MNAATARACLEVESKLSGANQRTAGTATVKMLPRIFRVESLDTSAPSNCATDRATVVISVFLVARFSLAQDVLGSANQRARVRLCHDHSLRARRESCPTSLPQPAGCRDLIPRREESLSSTRMACRHR